MGFYEAIPMMVEAVQFDGKNLREVKDLLSRQRPEGQVAIAGTNPLFLRTQNRPDRPMLPGDWLTLGPDNWVTVMSKEAFQRRMRPLGGS